MELDDLKTAWAEQSAALEASLRLNDLLVRQDNTRRAESRLGRLKRSIVIELVLDFVAVVALGAFAAGHAAHQAIAACAALLGLYGIAVAQGQIRQLVAIGAIDFDEPVVAIQRKLEKLRVTRIATIKWILLFAPLMWVPLAVVLARAALGVDLFAVLSPLYIAANVVFGLAVIPAAIWLTRRYADRLEGSGFVRALGREIAGSDLRAALEYLDTIDRFESAA